MPRKTLLLLTLLLLPSAAQAVWAPPGVDLTRPRLLMSAAEIPEVQAKLDATPLPAWTEAVLDRMVQHVELAAGADLEDTSVNTHRIIGRAARNLAFFYLVERQYEAGVVSPFADAAERQAVGDRAKELLLHLFPRSRLAVSPQLGGGWDRDISTSEELLNWASAYDALKAAGYDFGGDEAAIVEGIADIASELYLNYTQPLTATNFALLHQNNHRSKSGASLALAGIALAEYEAPAGSDPAGLRDPANWIDYGVDQADMILRVALNSGDGGYAEGPFYFRFTMQNLVPFLRVWDRLLGGSDYTAGPFVVPNLWRHPLHERMQRWMLDMTLPDGALVHIDDGNPGRSHYFAMVPTSFPDAPAYYWRWANAPSSFDVDGNVNLGPDVLVLYDPAIAPAPPDGSPTAFYPEAGNAIFRSDWSEEAVMAVALAEYDTSSLFGRDRDGRGLAPQGHEHPEPGSFLLNAFGEALALDPGYFTFGTRDKVSRPEHHNLILVDGAGPVGYLQATFDWSEPYGRPPVDGHARMSDTFDTDFLDAARVTSSYGFGLARPLGEAPLFERRFLFGDDRYLLVADRVTSRDGAPHDFTWLLHGHGGGIGIDGGPDGTFASTAAGGRWERTNARLDAGLALAGGSFSFATELNVHESPVTKDIDESHVTLQATANGEALTSLMLNYPSPTADAAPTLAELAVPGAAGLRLEDADGDRRIAAWHRAASGDTLRLDPAATGLAETASDGTLALFDARADGSLRLAYAEEATALEYDGVVRIASETAGTLAVSEAADRIAGLAETADDAVTLRGLPFVPLRADGACAFAAQPDGSVRVELNRERRFALHPGAGNSAPAADAGPDLRLPIGFTFRLDGGASCDADGDALTPHWRILSAPTQHVWRLAEPGAWNPELTLTHAGVYRLALTVTDANGAESRADEVVIHGGWSCQDGVDDDLDGLIDADDPTCEEGAESVIRWGQRDCGLGPELALLGLLAAARRRRISR